MLHSARYMSTIRFDTKDIVVFQKNKFLKELSLKGNNFGEKGSQLIGKALGEYS